MGRADLPRKILSGPAFPTVHASLKSKFYATVWKIPELSPTASEDAKAIVMDYARWQGSLRDFLPYETKRLGLNFNEIRRVLTITGMLPIKSGKSPRCRGTTQKIQPGRILVTDGKEVTVEFTSSGKKETLNRQGIVDQATACHTATVVTKTEDAKAVRKAYHDSVELIGSFITKLVRIYPP